MKRQHIHLAQGLAGEDGVISGMRQSSSVLIFLDLPKAMSAGIKFFLSDNGVVLTPGDDRGFVPPEFFSRVERSRTHESVAGFDGPRTVVAESLAHGNEGQRVQLELNEDEAAAEEAWAAIAQKNVNSASSSQTR